MKKLKLKLLSLLLLISSIVIGQEIKTKVTLYNKDYIKLRTLDYDKVMPVIDSLYKKDSIYYSAFYLVDPKDTIYIKRKVKSNTLKSI